MLSITKIFHFESAHRISDYDGACQQLHGHSYKLEVSISGNEIGRGDMLLDFKFLKSLVNSLVIETWDHALLLKDNGANRKDFSGLTDKICWMKTEPTAERMVLWIADKLSSNLPNELILSRLKLYETESSYAEWEDLI
ncbi:MAG TPA: 6-carboxytetrahydropterin synthase QueD [Anditalea sp.]|nr:6-carboxytetrahydropterin synthase QueD [Anditalea sp.]